MLNLFITAFIFGLVFNATPGPVFAETLRQGVRGGFRSALAVQFGSLAGDLIWAVVGLVGVGFLLQLESLRTPISLGSAAYLLWLARSAWRASREEFAVNLPGTSVDHHRAMRSGVWLSLTNAQNVAYWAAIGTALGGLGVKAPTLADNAVFFAGFMVSSTVWAFVVSALVDRAFRRLTTRWARLTYRACAVAFLLLALSMLRQLWMSSQHASTAQAPRVIPGEP